MRADRALPALAVAFALIVGCSRAPAPPRIQVGKPCVSCGMDVRDLRFASLWRGASGDRQYDSIECLLKDAGSAAKARGGIYLADYDDERLHPAESLWVVKGDFPTPMGGGLAAFATQENAREVADRTHGRVARYAELAGIVR